MKKLSAWLLVAAMSVSPTIVLAQVSDEMLFQFCSPFPFMELEIFIQETGEPRILTEESIRSLVERKLRVARVFAEKDAPPIVPSLRASVIKHNEAFSASIQYKRFLRGILEDRWNKVSVWDISRVGTAYAADRIISSIADEVDVFLSEFSFTQNSPECHAWKLEMRE